MRAAVYLRVSTEKQDTANQRPALAQLCAARGWEPVFFEETESGAKARPVLEGACERARRGEFPVLVVWALDRLGRDLWETIARVRGMWAAGVRIVSLQDSWIEGADGPVRDLLLMLLAWVASFERQRLRERTRAGVAKARASGKQLGRPRVDAEALAGAIEHVQQNGRGRPWLSRVEIARRYGLSKSALLRALRDARRRGVKIGY